MSSNVDTEALRQSARGYAQKTYEIGTAIRDIIESVGSGRIPVIQTSTVDGVEIFNGVQFIDVNSDVYEAAGLPPIDPEIIEAKQKSTLQQIIALEKTHRASMYATLGLLGFDVEAAQ